MSSNKLAGNTLTLCLSEEDPVNKIVGTISVSSLLRSSMSAEVRELLDDIRLYLECNSSQVNAALKKCLQLHFKC